MLQREIVSPVHCIPRISSHPVLTVKRYDNCGNSLGNSLSGIFYLSPRRSWRHGNLQFLYWDVSSTFIIANTSYVIENQVVRYVVHSTYVEGHRSTLVHLANNLKVSECFKENHEKNYWMHLKSFHGNFAIYSIDINVEFPTCTMHHNTEIVASPFPKPFTYFNRKIDTSPARTKLR